MSLAYKHISSVLDDYDVFLFDLWGVVIEGDYPYPGVVDIINYVMNHNKKVFFVTNAPRAASHLFPKIKSWGINLTKEMIMSSGEVAINMLLNSEEHFGIKYPLVYHLSVDKNDLMDAFPISTTTDIQEANMLLLTLHCDAGAKNLDEFDSLIRNCSKKRTNHHMC